MRKIVQIDISYNIYQQRVAGRVTSFFLKTRKVFQDQDNFSTPISCFFIQNVLAVQVSRGRHSQHFIFFITYECAH
jgi:hypothetical protein